MKTGDLIALIANIPMLFVYITYFKQVIKQQSVPNPATWLVWSAAMLLNALTYFFLSEKNWYKSSITIIVFILMALIMLYSWKKGKFSKLGLLEGNALFATCLVGALWWLNKETAIANFLLQIILLMSFVPTIVGLLTGANKEKWPPWLLAVITYMLFTTGIIVDFKGDYSLLAYPVINGMIGNGSVLTIILFQKFKNDKSRLKE